MARFSVKTPPVVQALMANSFGATLAALQSNNEATKAERISYAIFSKASVLRRRDELDVETYLQLSDITNTWHDARSVLEKASHDRDWRSREKFPLAPAEAEFYRLRPEVDISLGGDVLGRHRLIDMIFSHGLALCYFRQTHETFSAFRAAGQDFAACVNLTSILGSIIYFHPHSTWGD